MGDPMMNIGLTSSTYFLAASLSDCLSKSQPVSKSMLAPPRIPFSFATRTTLSGEYTSMMSMPPSLRLFSVIFKSILPSPSTILLNLDMATSSPGSSLRSLPDAPLPSRSARSSGSSSAISISSSSPSSCRLSSISIILPISSLILSSARLNLLLPASVLDNTSFILSTHAGVCARPGPPSRTRMHPSHPGVYSPPKSVFLKYARLALIPASSGNAMPVMSASLILTGTLMSFFPGFGLPGVPFTLLIFSILHLSSGGLLFTENAFTTPSSVPITCSPVLLLRPSQIPSFHFVSIFALSPRPSSNSL